jgi:hypothetical protein
VGRGLTTRNGGVFFSFDSRELITDTDSEATVESSALPTVSSGLFCLVDECCFVEIEIFSLSLEE